MINSLQNDSVVKELFFYCFKNSFVKRLFTVICYGSTTCNSVFEYTHMKKKCFNSFVYERHLSQNASAMECMYREVNSLRNGRLFEKCVGDGTSFQYITSMFNQRQNIWFYYS